jgi:hypothetical protein
MEPFNLDHICPPWLEDESLLIEHAGEMPEVALAESLKLLGKLPEEDLKSLHAACARGYVLNIKRDLSPSNIGLPAFRGLERARANLARLQTFLAIFGACLAKENLDALSELLSGFLQAEQIALNEGRLYSAASTSEVAALAEALELDLEPWRTLMDRIKDLPNPDFIGLRALKRLDCIDPAFKRRKVHGDHLLIELLDPAGNPLARAALPWHSDVSAVAQENRARAEMIWQLLSAPEHPGD